MQLQAVLELALANVSVMHCRIEDYHPATRYTTVISRALGMTVALFFKRAAPLLQPTGRVIVMKGARPEPELAELQANGLPFEVAELRIPALHKQRHLVVIDAE